jgi:MFS family permease
MRRARVNLQGERVIGSLVSRYMPGGRRPFYGWAIVLVGGLVAFSSGPGQSFVFSMFIDSMIADTGLSRTDLSLLYAVGTGVSALMVMIVSRLADRLGPRTTLIAVGVVFGFVCIGMGLAMGAISFFVAFAALRAFGQGSLPINSTLLVASWFVERRGRAMAMVGLGFAASNAILPPVSQFMINTIGWREAYMALGVMVWALVLPGAVFLVRNTPEDMGLHPDNRDRPPANEPAPTHVKGEPDRRPVFTSPTFWLLALPLATPSFVSTALIFHQVSIFAERGLSAAVAASVFVPYAFVSAGASLGGGFIVDRFGPKTLFGLTMIALMSATLMALVIASPLLAVAYALVLGVQSGFQRIVSSTTWAHFYGRRNLGRIQGSAMMVGITSAAIGPLPVAFLQEQTGAYTVPILAMAALPVIALVLIFFARPKPYGHPEPTSN